MIHFTFLDDAVMSWLEIGIDPFYSNSLYIWITAMPQPIKSSPEKQSINLLMDPSAHLELILQVIGCPNVSVFLRL